MKRVVSGIAGALAQGFDFGSKRCATLSSALQFFRVRYLMFTPRVDDIYVVSYPRSGTTLVQCLLWELSPWGGTDYGHLSSVSPWFERRCAKGDTMEQFPSPRLFKTHLPYRAAPKPAGRYIYVVRDGLDVMVSYFHFYARYMNYRGTIESFFESFITGKLYFGSWFKHIEGWLGSNLEERMLVLSYADIVESPAEAAEAIVEFCEFSPSAEQIERAVERCRFDWMKANEKKFDHGIELLMEQGVSPGGFIRQGRSGTWTEQLKMNHYARYRKYLTERITKRTRRVAGLTD